MYLLISSIIFLSSAVAEDFENLRIYYWAEPPEFVVCEGSGVSLAIVKEAANFWRNQGQNIGRVYKRSCGDEMRFGEVEFYMLDDLRPVNENSNITNDFTIKGLTNLNVYKDDAGAKTSEVSRGKIYINSSYAQDLDLFKHEMGHALGYGHSDVESSVLFGSDFVN